MQENNQILDLQTKVSLFPDQAKTIRVTDIVTLNAANEFVHAVRAMLKKVADAFDPIIKRAHETHRQAIEERKKYEEPLLQAEKIAKGEIGHYLSEQDRLRRKAEEKARREHEEAERKRLEAIQAAIEAEQAGKSEEAEKILEEELSAVPEVKIAPAIKIQGTSMRKILRWRIVDINAVPRELMVVNETKVSEIVRREGEKAMIPGIEIYWDEIVILRPSLEKQGDPEKRV